MATCPVTLACLRDSFFLSIILYVCNQWNILNYILLFFLRLNSPN